MAYFKMIIIIIIRSQERSVDICHRFTYKVKSVHFFFLRASVRQCARSEELQNMPWNWRCVLYFWIQGEFKCVVHYRNSKREFCYVESGKEKSVKMVSRKFVPWPVPHNTDSHSPPAVFSAPKKKKKENIYSAFGETYVNLLCFEFTTNWFSYYSLFLIITFLKFSVHVCFRWTIKGNQQ